MIQTIVLIVSEFPYWYQVSIIRRDYTEKDNVNKFAIKAIWESKGMSYIKIVVEIVRVFVLIYTCFVIKFFSTGQGV